MHPLYTIVRRGQTAMENTPPRTLIRMSRVSIGTAGMDQERLAKLVSCAGQVNASIEEVERKETDEAKLVLRARRVSGMVEDTGQEETKRR